LLTIITKNYSARKNSLPCSMKKKYNFPWPK
jgi:hypothetical protein